MDEPFFPMDVVGFVARSARITVDDIQGSCKARIFTRARAVVSIVLRERGYSYKHIGRLLNKDHATIMHAVEVFDARYGDDPAAQEMLDYTRWEFGGDAPKKPQQESPEVKANRSYDLRSLKENATRDIPFEGAAEERRIRRAASNMNERTDMYFSANRVGNVMRITRVR